MVVLTVKRLGVAFKLLRYLPTKADLPSPRCGSVFLDVYCIWHWPCWPSVLKEKRKENENEKKKEKSGYSENPINRWHSSAGLVGPKPNLPDACINSIFLNLGPTSIWIWKWRWPTTILVYTKKLQCPLQWQTVNSVGNSVIVCEIMSCQIPTKHRQWPNSSHRRILCPFSNVFPISFIYTNIWISTLRATSHTSQEPWPWKSESPKESVQRLSQVTSKTMYVVTCSVKSYVTMPSTIC